MISVLNLTFWGDEVKEHKVYCIGSMHGRVILKGKQDMMV